MAQAIVGDTAADVPRCGYVSAPASGTSRVRHHGGTTRKIEAAGDSDLIDAGHFVLDFAGQRAGRIAEGWHNCPCAGSLAEHPGEGCDADDCGQGHSCFCRCSSDCLCPCAELREAPPEVEQAAHVCTDGPCPPWAPCRRDGVPA